MNMKSELAIKLDEWLATDEGQRCKYPQAYTQSFSHDEILEKVFLAGAGATNEVAEELASKVVEETVINKLNIENGSMDIQLKGGACQILADSFAEQFKDNNATNYLEVGLYSPETGPMTVTIQRVHGLTPCGKIQKIKELINAGDIDAALAI
jgi:hypothetical protein